MNGWKRWFFCGLTLITLFAAVVELAESRKAARESIQPARAPMPAAAPWLV
jgi:hypothetical protein